MTDKEVKRLMADRINELGGHALPGWTVREIAKAAKEVGLEVQRGREIGSFKRILGLVQERALREPYKFREYRPKPHPRLADIQKAQPKLWTPGGIGNGMERVNGYARGS